MTTFNHNGKILEILQTVSYTSGKRPNLEAEMKAKGIVATHFLTTKNSGSAKFSVNEFSNGTFGKITSWK